MTEFIAKQVILKDNGGNYLIPYTGINVESKANIDANNFSKVGKELISGMGMPSERYIDLSLGASGSIYTAPANGMFTVWLNGGDVYYTIQDSNGKTLYTGGAKSSYTYGASFNVVCPKGYKLSLNYAGNLIEPKKIRFIYAEGSKE